MIRTALFTIISLTVMGCIRPDKQQAKQGPQNHQADSSSEKSFTSKNEDSLSAFIPKGYTILSEVVGDLNLDSYPDMALVLENKESDPLDYPARSLILLLGQADSSYKQSARNDSVVLCALCGGIRADPFIKVIIKKGYFSIEQYGGMNTYEWERTTTFKYSNVDQYWYLYKDALGEYSVDVEDTSKEKATTTLKTVKEFGKVPFDKFNINQDIK